MRRLLIGLVQQRRQQVLAPVGQAVDRQAFEASSAHEPGVEQDPQVAADAALLALGNQAQVANAGFAGIGQDLEQGQAVRITERLGLASEQGGSLEIEQLRTQPLSFPRLRPTQSWWRVSDGTTD